MGGMRRRREEAEAGESARIKGDLDRRRRIEQIIGELGGGYWDIIENSSSLIQSVEPDGHYFYVNRAWRDTLGYGEEEAKRLTFLDVVHPDYHPHCTEVFRQMMTERRGFERVECDFVSRDGRRIPVEGNVSCRFEGGSPVATRGFFKVVSAHHGEEAEAGEETLEGIKLEEIYLEFHDLVSR